MFSVTVTLRLKAPSLGARRPGRLWAHPMIRMEDGATPERSAPRSSADIFGDLRTLAHGDGALHGLSAIIYRDWLITVDTQEGRVTEDPERRWSSSKSLFEKSGMSVFSKQIAAHSDEDHGV